MPYIPIDPNVEAVAKDVVDAAYHLHEEIGPGMLESVYEAMLAVELGSRKRHVLRQVSIPITHKGLTYDEGFKADLLVDECLIVELKSVESLHPVHAKQLLTYLRMSKLRLGLLLNFGSAYFRDGVKRIVN